jgi:hypothetical protein
VLKQVNVIFFNPLFYGNFSDSLLLLRDCTEKQMRERPSERNIFSSMHS